MTHAGRVNCIYIDPPYNTGNRDFINNDRFVDKDDAYRHSKWLEFMYRRLTLEKDLLAEDRVIFVSIGEEEACHLKLLMDQTIDSLNFIGQLTYGKVVKTKITEQKTAFQSTMNMFLVTAHPYLTAESIVRRAYR